MAPDEIHLRIEHLTDLDKLELIKVLAPGSVRFEQQRPADGRLGELDTITAIVTITLATINTAGFALAIWLSRGGRQGSIHDQIEVVTEQGSYKRTLNIKGSSHDELQPEVIKFLHAAFPGTTQTPSPPTPPTPPASTDKDA